MIYFSKFPNGNSDYFLLLLARAAFSLRVYKSSIYRATQRDYALEFLEKVYFVSFEEDLEQNLLDFIATKIEEERKAKNEENKNPKHDWYLKKPKKFMKINAYQSIYFKKA